MASADGDALILLLDAVKVATNGPACSWAGGDGLLEVDGTWGGSTFKLQFSFDGGTTFKDLDSSVAFTANGATVFSLPSGFIRGVVSATPTALTARVKRIPS